MKAHLTFGIFLFLVTVWCAGIVAAPLLRGSPGVGGRISGMLYETYGRVCHQIDGRSFHLHDQKFAVCARCSSVYAGFWMSLLLYPLVWGMRKRSVPPVQWLLLAALPMVGDVVLSVTGIHGSTLLTRGLTGMMLGFVLPLFTVPTLMEATERLGVNPVGRADF
jgi:uncharacterized membrane protein